MTRAPVQTAPRPTQSRARGMLGPAAVLAVTAAGVAMVTVVDPHEPGHYPTCPFLALTGFYCPGCGAMRMVNSLTHGHLGAAFGLNPLLFLLLPVFVYLYGRWSVLSARGEPMSSVLFRPWVAQVFLVVLVAYWILRNLPFAHALAP